MYAYHWTELGTMVLEKYGFDKAKPNTVAAPVGEVADATSLGLSKEAADLIVEAARDKNGKVMMVGTMHGYTVQTNGRNFTKGADAKQVALWKAAVEELYRRDFLEDRAGKHEVFQVTSAGFKAAEILVPSE